VISLYQIQFRATVISGDNGIAPQLSFHFQRDKPVDARDQPAATNNLTRSLRNVI
jgi:hypothetical protein